MMAPKSEPSPGRASPSRSCSFPAGPSATATSTAIRCPSSKF